MSRAINLVAKNLPGYGPSDGICFPCSGVSGKAVCVSPYSSCGDYMILSRANIVSLRCISRNAFLVSSANSSSHRRNPGVSRQNKHGFNRSRYRQNEERNGFDNLEESGMLSSKNGPLISGFDPKPQATSAPGPREKEIVELFRKVQAQLRERKAIKSTKKIEDSQAQSRETENVDSLLKLLRKHSVQQGKRSSNSSRSEDFILDQPEQNHLLADEEKIADFIDSSSSFKHEPQDKVPSLGRPRSSFRRRSPVPRVKFMPAYSNEDTHYYASLTNSIPERKETIHELEPELNIETETETELDLNPTFLDGDVFPGMIEGETFDTVEDDKDDDEVVSSSVVRMDLSGMNVKELRALAKSRGFRGFSKLKKHELVELLKTDDGPV